MGRGVRDVEGRVPPPGRRPRRRARRSRDPQLQPRAGVRHHRAHGGERAGARPRGAVRGRAAQRAAGRPPEEYGMNPMSFGEMRDGCYEIDARVRDMNVNGVLGSMCFPSFPGFGGRMFHAGGRAGGDSALPVLQAYNDWHVDEWCGTHPGRFVPLAIPPVWDQDAMVAEVRRMAAKGCHAFTFSENPEKTGFPSLHNEWWDPFWATCADEGTIVCFHIGSSSEIPITSVESPVDVTLTLMPV